MLKRKVAMPRLAGREPVRLDECTEKYERGARTKELRAQVCYLVITPISARRAKEQRTEVSRGSTQPSP